MKNRLLQWLCVVVVFCLLATLSLHFFKLPPHIDVYADYVSIVFVFILAVLLWFVFQRIIKLESEQSVFNSVTQTLKEYMEIVVINLRGKILFSTDMEQFPTKSEFIRKLLSRVNPTNESMSLKQTIDDFQSGEFLVHGGGNGMIQPKQWWLSHVSPCSKHDSVLGELLFVSLTNLSKYFENYEQLKHNYKLLETFIDHAPFGLLYLNKTDHIVATNATLCSWIGQSKESLLGQLINHYVEDSSLQLLNELDKPTQLTLRTKRDNTINVLCLPPARSSTQQAIILCRLDYAQENTLSLAENQEFWKQSSFLKGLIPAIIIDTQYRIKGFNSAFTTMVIGSVKIDNDQLKIDDDLLGLIDTAKKSETVENLKNGFSSNGMITPFEFDFAGGSIHSVAYMNYLGTTNIGSNQKFFIIQFIDSSEQKRLEQQFIQSQKMQAVGQLAGGIAHDFNNLLTAMIGFCDLLLQRYMPNDPSFTDVMQIKQNANRAANLVRQLLAFSRQQTLQPKIIQITDVLAELTSLLRRLIGAGIHLQVTHGREVWPIKADISQLEQVIINLAVNARDAMKNGGTLTIKTGNYECLQQRQVGHDVMVPGSYSIIEVIDTGHGIAPEHLEHIFEPFFSTKEIGKGTGLGLSTVYGIVKQTGGYIEVDSQVGAGTSFKIYLPRYAGKESIHASTLGGQDQSYSGDLTGDETILLVEDEEAVRQFSARALRDKGYTVIEADCGESALKLVQQGKRFDIIVTDVVMPIMDGPTLAKKVREIIPNCKIIFISGYTEDTFRKNLDLDAHIHFLPKPFTLHDLAAKVKEILSLKS